MERNASGGYLAIKKESVKGTAVTPDTFVPYYKQDFITDPNFISDTPVFGNLFKRLQTLQGLRSHKGGAQVMAEPNSCAMFLDMLATRTATSGSDPYTHTFGVSNTTDPHSYTLDISLVSQVIRFMGVEASKLKFGFDGDKMVLDLDFSALKSFYGREIASLSGSGPYTVTLKTDYDPSPTDGLVVGDLIQFKLADGTTVNATVASIPSGTTFTTATNPTVSAGDMVVLRPSTPSLATLTPFLWPRTQFFFAADAATALTNSATASNQVRLDRGSQITLMHEFDDDAGTPRSGAFDPASLPRTVYDLEVKIKKYFDRETDIKYWNALTKRALIMRSYSGSNKELRITLNNLRALTNETPTEFAGVIIADIDYAPNHDLSDSQAFDTKLINGLATI